MHRSQCDVVPLKLAAIAATVIWNRILKCQHLAVTSGEKEGTRVGKRKLKDSMEAMLTKSLGSSDSDRMS